MSEKPINASLSIDAKYIEAEVQKIVKAAIAATLGNRDELIRKAIDTTIDQYVDKDGQPCKKDSWKAMPYLDFVAQKTVEKVVREAICETVEENADAFKEEIKRQLGSRKCRENAAQAFIQVMLDDAKSEWGMPVRISFQKLKD